MTPIHIKSLGPSFLLSIYHLNIPLLLLLPLLILSSPPKRRSRPRLTHTPLSIISTHSLSPPLIHQSRLAYNHPPSSIPLLDYIPCTILLHNRRLLVNPLLIFYSKQHRLPLVKEHLCTVAVPYPDVFCLRECGGRGEHIRGNEDFGGEIKVESDTGGGG